jgi:predicted nucleotidyltransferase
MIRQLPQLDFDPAKLEELCHRWQIVELWVFGSAARNEMRPDSDVDLMVRFAEGDPWGLWDFVTLQDELPGVFGREVEVMEKGPIRNPYKRRSIERDLKLLLSSAASSALTRGL